MHAYQLWVNHMPYVSEKGLAHRPNPDGKFDSMWTDCYLTAAHAENEDGSSIAPDSGKMVRKMSPASYPVWSNF